MATGSIRADSAYKYPHPHAENHARARYPQRACNHARTRNPRIADTRGYARVLQNHNLHSLQATAQHIFAWEAGT
jgi:hypothetical protein